MSKNRTIQSSDDIDLRQQVSTIAEDVKELGRQLKGATRREARHARESATELYETGRNQVARLAERFEDRVQARPLHSIATAAAVGGLIGWLFRRR